MTFFHAGFVVRKRDGHGIAGGTGKAQELGDLVFVAEVFAQPFFQHCAELSIELGELTSVFFVVFARVFSRHVVLGQVFEDRQDATGIAFANRFDITAFLQ